MSMGKNGRPKIPTSAKKKKLEVIKREDGQFDLYYEGTNDFYSGPHSESEAHNICLRENKALGFS